jgi:hypothetical protein
MIRSAAEQPPLSHDLALQGRRVLDLAEGILIGLRRYPTGAAFEELITVARRHDVSLSAVAAALVALATGDHTVAESDPAACEAALQQWRELLADKLAENEAPATSG